MNFYVRKLCVSTKGKEDFMSSVLTESFRRNTNFKLTVPTNEKGKFLKQKKKIKFAQV